MHHAPKRTQVVCGIPARLASWAYSPVWTVCLANLPTKTPQGMGLKRYFAQIFALAEISSGFTSDRLQKSWVSVAHEATAWKLHCED